MDEPADQDLTGFTAPRAVEPGTAHYYLDRLADFRLRSPGLSPPSYYADYGHKCLHQFLATKPALSPRGKRWVEDTMRLLQSMMEDERRRDAVRFAALERDDDAFTDFAFGTHSRAYDEAGVFELGVRDLWKIVRTPDLSDLLTDKGVREIVQLVFGLDGHVRPGLDADRASMGEGVLGGVSRSARRVRPKHRRSS